MGSRNSLESFEGGDFEEYRERLEFYFAAHDIGVVNSGATRAERDAATRKKAATLVTHLHERRGLLSFKVSVFTPQSNDKNLRRAEQFINELLQADSLCCRSHGEIPAMQATAN